MHSTRKKGLYKFEMSDEEHKQLLFTILNLKNAKVLISGYDNELYNQLLINWKKDYIKSLDGCGQMKTEVIWCNYPIVQQGNLF